MEFRGGARAGWRVAGSLLCLVSAGSWSPASAVEGSAAQILYFEPLQISVPTSERVHQKTSAYELRKLQLTAYGREYVVSVESNETFHASLTQKPSRSSLKLYRGAIDGLDGSWVRLATKGTDVHGMMWDGQQAFVIAPSDEIHDQLVPPLRADGGTVIFRLADVLLPTPSMSCASESHGEPLRASEAYASLTSEMQQATADARAGATRKLELSVLGDSHFLAQHADEQDARESILMRLNIVDGIFSSQVGVQIQAPLVNVHTKTSDPFSSATNPSTLLDELATLRRRTPELRARGLTHLFTGRNLQGSTVGIGYVDSLCDSKFGSALTEVTHRGSWYESLIAAHEIGHNFGAVHDGQAGKACASTPQGVYLMSPNVNGGETFSQCSLDLMRPNIARASCITPLPPANIAVAADLGALHRPIATAFEWELPVTNAGGAAALNVRAEINVPAAVAVEEAYVIGSSCTSGAGIVQCHLGTIPGGSSRSVYLRLRSNEAGSSSISATVFAQGEKTTSDNSGMGTLVIGPEADVSLSADGPLQANISEAFDVRFTVMNAAAIDANALRATIQLPAGFVAHRAMLPEGACTIETTVVTCSLPSLASGESSNGSLSVAAAHAGNATIRMNIRGGYVDPNAANDAAELSVQISSAVAAHASQASSGGSGGGGSGSALLLTLLSMLALRRIASDTTR